jgi:hypothetical protein
MYTIASQHRVVSHFACCDAIRAVLASLAIAIGPALGFDELPDDYVERTLAVIVRGREVSIEFCVGVNERTLRKMLTRGLQDNSLEPDSLEKKNALASGRDQSTAVDVSLPIAAKPLTSLDLEQLHERLRRTYFNKLLDDLRVTVNNQESELTKVSIEQSARHHFSWVAKYAFQIPSGQKMFDLTIQDNSFPEYNGAVRYALKATGSAMVLKSNVAPIIVRSKRFELANLNADERSATCRISASLGFADQGPTTGK